MLTKETRSTYSSTGPSAAYFTIIPKQAGQVLRPDWPGTKPGLARY